MIVTMSAISCPASGGSSKFEVTPSGGLTALVTVGAPELLLVIATVAVMLMAAIIRGARREGELGAESQSHPNRDAGAISWALPGLALHENRWTVVVLVPRYEVRLGQLAICKKLPADAEQDFGYSTGFGYTPCTFRRSRHCDRRLQP